MRLDNSNNPLFSLNRLSCDGAADQRLPGRQRASVRRRRRVGPAARLATSAARLSAEVGSPAPRRDRPVEHAVEIEIGRFLDAIGRRIGPDADQPLGIAAVDGQQAAHAFEKLERLDDDDVLDLAERVVAVDEIGQMPGEIGDDVAARIGRRRSAHGSNLSRSRRQAVSRGPTRAMTPFRHYQPDRHVDKRARRSRRRAPALVFASRNDVMRPEVGVLEVAGLARPRRASRAYCACRAMGYARK